MGRVDLSNFNCPNYILFTFVLFHPATDSSIDGLTYGAATPLSSIDGTEAESHCGGKHCCNSQKYNRRSIWLFDIVSSVEEPFVQTDCICVVHIH